MKNIYYLALEALLKNLQEAPERKINLTYCYKDLNFIPPNTIYKYDINYLDNVDNSIIEKFENGILRLVEMEPVDVVRNYLEIKFNHILYLNFENRNIDETLLHLNSFEKESVLKLMERSNNKVSSDYYINNQHSIVTFSYDCESSQFIITKFNQIDIPVV
jgi:hypothetical protein